MNEQNTLYSTWGELRLNFSGFILVTGSVAVLLPYSIITQNLLFFIAAIILTGAGIRLLWLSKVRKDLRMYGKSNLINTKNVTKSEKQQKQFSAVMIVGGMIVALSSSLFLMSNGQLVISLLVIGLTACAFGIRAVPNKGQQLVPPKQ